MKKLFATLALIAISFPSFSATIHWFSDETDTTTLPSNFVFAAESPGPPQGYRSVRWGTMLKLLGTSTNYLQNLYITSNYVTYLTVESNLTVNGKTTINNDITVVSNAYFNNTYTTNLTVYSNAYFYETNFANYTYTTNLFVESNAYFFETNFANYTYTTNLFVESNAYFFETNFANYTYTTNLFVESNAYFFETNFVNYEYVTNLTVESNAYITEVFVNVETITNNLHVVTNSWDGPTNPLPMFYAWQAYRAFTPCEITGITGRSNYVTSATLLTITNASDSNITLYLPDDVRTGDGARSYIVTNAQVGKLSVEYDPNGATNAVYRMFY